MNYQYLMATYKMLNYQGVLHIFIALAIIL